MLLGFGFFGRFGGGFGLVEGLEWFASVDALVEDFGLRLERIGLVALAAGGHAAGEDCEGGEGNNDFHGTLPFVGLTKLRLDGCHGGFAELADKPAVAFVEQPQVADTILEHSQPFNPGAKGEAGIGGGF